MAAIIKIKRSNGTSAPSSLNAGELAFTYDGSGDNTNQGTSANNGERLFIGDGSNVHVIGGKYFTDMLDHTAGTLTASSAIVVDSNSKINNLKVDNLDLDGNTLSATDTNGGVTISANGTGAVDVSKLTINSGTLTFPTADGTSGQILTTDGSGNVSFSSPASSSFTLTDGTNSDTFNTGETLTFTGGNAVDATVSDNTITLDVAVDDSSIEVSSDALQVKALGITNAMLAGSIENAKLSNSTVSFGGVSLALGGTDATPAFDLQDATNLPTTSLTGTITNAQLAGSIENGKLSNSTVSFGGVSLALGGTDATPAFDLADAYNYPGDDSLVSTGTITSGTWQGTAIADAYVANDLTISGGTVDNTVIGGTTAAAGSFTTVSASGNTSVGGNLTVTGDLTINGTTTTVNTTTVTIEDPIFTMGDDSADDNKDRGIEFKYNDGSTKVGFFGYDDSTQKFTFIADATNTSEVFSGTAGDVAFGDISGTIDGGTF